MLASLRHKVLSLSAEEQQRRERVNRSLRGSASASASATASAPAEGESLTGAGTKRRRRKKEPLPVGVDRVVLFNFVADGDHKEQVSVHVNDLVFVVEDCADGWSVVETKGHNKRRGVVPTSYLGPVKQQQQQQQHHGAAAAPPPPAANKPAVPAPAPAQDGGSAASAKSFITGFFTLNLSQRVDALKAMFVAWLKEKTIVFFQMVFLAVRVLIFDGIFPGIVFVIKLFTLNESYTTISSSVVRSAFGAGMVWIIPSLTEPEIEALTAEVRHFSQAVHEEQARRDAAVKMLRGEHPLPDAPSE